ncbi:MAG: VWA domain-containing protein [Lachnospiraceae bacterium]|nr:VWA domain-containing protein [Candidatus Colinaster scatohippi]
MKRKMVAMLLSVVIVGSMVAGCGKKTAEETTNYVVSDAVADCAEEPAVDVSRGTYCEEEVEYDCREEYEDLSGEKYDSIEENGWISVEKKALSTFAADVDTASYSNFRRMVLDGYGLNRIPASAIRTEEMVNYFTYNYEEPKNGEVFGVTPQVSVCPWNSENLLMTIGINTATLDSKDIPDCNIVFLVDVSGSMRGEKKLPLIQKSMAMLTDKFDENDRISIVTYASGVETILNGCSGDDSRKIIKSFEKLSAGGSTNGGDGIVRAYEIAEDNFIEDGVNRVIICSDGDFNVGLTTQSELERLITEKKDSGIFLSTLGFGMGNYSDVTMETLADKGNGNYAYIDDLTEAKRVLIDEMSSTFVTVAKDVKLQVEFNPAAVSEYRLVGYENRVMSSKDFTDDTKDGGELGAGHQVTVVYEICPTDNYEETDLKYQEKKPEVKGSEYDEYCTLSIAYKEPDGNKSRYLEYPINYNNFDKNPSDDFRLAAAVAQASLALKGSEYIADYNMEEAILESLKTVKSLKKHYDNEYVAEFADLLEELTY